MVLVLGAAQGGTSGLCVSREYPVKLAVQSRFLMRLGILGD